MGLLETDQTRSKWRWYAVHVRPRAERIASVNLERQRFRTFLPVRIKTTRHARQFRTGLAPVFPGYVFVALDPARDRWRSINGTHGVVSLVMAGNWPIPVPQGIVETLLLLSSGRGMGHAGNDLKLGQRVRMLAGPFAEMIGMLERLDDRGRVRVLLDMMGTRVPVSSTTGLLASA